jgi:antitoxin component of MazEF toxin-antitoxin module
MRAKSRIIKNGNKAVINIPNDILEASGLESVVYLTAEKDQIIISCRKHPRDGWSEQIAKLENTIKEAEKDYVAGRNIHGKFDTAEEMIADLEK